MASNRSDVLSIVGLVCVSGSCAKDGLAIDWTRNGASKIPRKTKAASGESFDRIKNSEGIGWKLRYLDIAFGMEEARRDDLM